jgi:hypothetical protein
MKKNLLFTVLVILTMGNLPASAQTVKQVFIDNSKGMVNQGAPLPAGSLFYLTGGINEDVTLVKAELFRNEKASSLVFSNQWKRHYSDEGQAFYIPVDYKLQPNSKYNVHLTYFKTIRGEELESFRRKIHTNLQAYVDAVTAATEKKVQLNGSVNENMSRLNSIMENAFTYYSSHREQKFGGFSDIVRLKLEQIKDAGLNNAKYNVQQDTTLTQDGQKQQYASQLKTELTNVLKAEADEYIAAGVRIKYDEITLKSYPTERTKSYLPVNVGYGAVYLGGDVDDLEYSARPYVGISIPFGNPKINRYVGNASFSLGVFLSDFKNKQGEKITGPIISRPFYAGLGYRIFDFLKLNAGVVATSMERVDLNNFKTEKVTLRPFVGVSAEFNVSIGSGR